MSFSSPLAAVCHVIRQVQATAAANAVLLRNNEAATRAALIDPVLRVLGWNTADVQVVEPERTVANKQTLDYVLKDAQGKIRSVIEAKKMGESLDKLGHVGALIGYAFSLKPLNFFITDGLNWHCYAPTHSSYEPVATLNLQQAHPVEAALQLVQWLDAAHGGHGMEPVNATTPEHTNPAMLPGKLGTLVIKPLLKTKSSGSKTIDFIDVTQLHLLNLPPNQRPKQLRLPNGAIKPIGFWKDILLEVCQLVLAANPNLPIPFPDKAGKKRALISDNKQPVGASTKVMYNGKSVFIGTNYSAAACIANAIYAAKQLPAKQQSVGLALRF